VLTSRGSAVRARHRPSPKSLQRRSLRWCQRAEYGVVVEIGHHDWASLGCGAATARGSSPLDRCGCDATPGDWAEHHGQPAAYALLRIARLDAQHAQHAAIEALEAARFDVDADVVEHPGRGLCTAAGRKHCFARDLAAPPVANPARGWEKPASAAVAHRAVARLRLPTGRDESLRPPLLGGGMCQLREPRRRLCVCWWC
jgi:hypothetical protein